MYKNVYLHDMPKVSKLKLYSSSTEIYTDGYFAANIISAESDLLFSYGAAYLLPIFHFCFCSLKIQPMKSPNILN